MHDRTVFARERNHIRHGGDRRQIDPLHGFIPSQQRARDLPRHARAAQIGKRIIVQQRVDRGAIRQTFAHAMMIGYDAGKLQRFGKLDQIMRSDAAVHRNQQIIRARDFAHGVFV